jgi:lysyl-tRNA synthetase class 2
MTRDREGSTESEESRGRLEEALQARRASLERLRARGIEPFALRFATSADAASLHQRFDGIAAGEVTSERAAVAGRIVLKRDFGKLTFLTLRDATADIQLMLSREAMGEGYDLVRELDLGDIVGAVGVVMKTKKGELSVRAESLEILAKALRPLPEKYRGLRDPEARLRQRYLEFATSPESRRVIRVRAEILRTVRRVLDERGFLEVETPVLQPMASGAMARPFTTHHEALGMPLYLRIAPELYLKRLLVAGMDRVYEIGRNFRNEGIDRDHNPEFTMLEFYQAYGDYEDIMRLAEELIREAALAVRGALAFDYQGRTLDLEGTWRRVPLLEAISDTVGEPVDLDLASLRSLAERNGLAVAPSAGLGPLVKELYEKLVEPSLFDPAFVMDFPREISPLARSHRSEPGLTEQFDLVIAGMEIGPGYSELNDPDEQRARFEQQAGARAAGDDEAHPFDEDFLLALEHGMPPAGGIGIGIDRLTMILADVPSIRDVILFPHVRPR